MSEDHKKPMRSVLEAVKARVQYVAMRKSLRDSLSESRKWLDAQVNAGTLPKEIADDIFATIEQTSVAPPEPTAAELDVMAFIERLTNRQGNIAPDFGALYKRKAELDQDSNDHRP